MVLFTKGHSNVGSLVDTGLHMHRGHASLCRAYVESHLSESFLKASCHLPQTRTKLVAFRTVYDFKTLEAALDDRHRQRFRIDLGTEIITEIIYHSLVRRYETADDGH